MRRAGWWSILTALMLALPGLSSSATRPASAAPTLQRKNAVNDQYQSPRPKTKRIGIVLFDDFETLDVFGPVQMWGRLPDYDLVIVSQDGRPVRSAQGVTTEARYSFADAPQFEILMVPGGMGARKEVGNATMLDFLRRQDGGSEWTTSVCTGSALLARAGILDRRRATSNKQAYAWATSQSAKVRWQPRARWVVDGKYMTSSGVSAGTNMALALVERLYGRAAAQDAARIAEYQWNADPADDLFAANAG